jgi:tetratricopeptide (TPR) repeat protein
VGSATCAECHRAESEAYSHSHHAKALTATNAETFKPLVGTHFASKLGGTTSFMLRGEAPVVRTTTAKGKVEVLRVPYVSGVWPLQQFVVETERGKLQSLGVVWDSREPTDGGKHWFHVYGANGISPQEPLFFTSAAQNWNHMCADCHSTLVERHYDVANDRFATQWAELSVGCEACHGPGADHVNSARINPTQPTKLAARLQSAKPWAPSATGSPTPRHQDGAEVETCAPCHSRRAPLAEGFLASDAFLDHFAPELLWPGRYHADGQVEGEVYEWGSFTQSRMYQAGVACSDCHNPHSGKTYASGDALCGRCHEPERFETPLHSHHSGVNAPACIDCHMPPATFMQVDERRDHSIRVPRPDHSVAFGTPNACNGCHGKQPATWAREWARKWYPTLEERKHFVEALGKERQGAPDAPHALRKLAGDVTAPAIARATALERLGRYPSAKTLETFAAAVRGTEPLVVYGAVLGATQLPPTQRKGLLIPLVHSDVLAVRAAVGKALAGAIATEPNELVRLFDEVERTFYVSASRVETHIERSAFELARGRSAEAASSLETALRLEPCLVAAYLNLAEVERQRGDEAAAHAAIRSALTCSPKDAGARYALGLWYVRAKQPAAALRELQKAVELAPYDARFSYVFAVALAGGGKFEDAVRILDTSLANQPNDLESLRALARYLADSGQPERAAETQRRLDALSSE